MQGTTKKSDVVSGKIKSVVFPPNKSALQNRFLSELGRKLQTLLTSDTVEFVVAPRTRQTCWKF